MPESALKALDALRTTEDLYQLCQQLGIDAHNGTGAGAGAVHLQPRGLVNTGNTCFLNASAQLLMGASDFCGLMHALALLAPGVDGKRFPTVAAYGRFGAALLTTPPDAAGKQGEDEEEEQQQERGWRLSPQKGKKGQKGQAGTTATANGPGSRQQPVPGVFMSPPFVPSMLDPIVAAFSPHRAQQQKEARNKVSYAAASRTRLQEQSQEDAQEFIQHLLSKLHEELAEMRKVLKAGGCVSSRKAVPANSSSNASMAAVAKPSGEDDDGEEWATVVGPRNKAATARGSKEVAERTPVSQLFGGAMQSTVRTRPVGPGAPSKPSVTQQPMFAVHLEAHHNSLEEAFAALTRPEQISGYKANDKAAPTDAEKTYKLAALPQVFLVHILDYAFGVDDGTSKLHHRMRFGPELRIQPSWVSDCCPNRRDARYRLVSTVTHHGRHAAGGHYTAHVRQPNGAWLLMNDAEVMVVKEPRVLNDTPYLLMYERV